MFYFFKCAVFPLNHMYIDVSETLRQQEFQRRTLRMLLHLLSKEARRQSLNYALGPEKD